MRKFLIVALSIALAFLLFLQTGLFIGLGLYPFGYKKSVLAQNNAFIFETKNGVKYRSRAQGNYLQFFTKGKWENLFLKGVNIGAGEPGLFPGDLTISYEDYLKWFEQISAMNANCIRVYTTMRPQFYTALLDFNSKAEKPLYIFQGVWINEDDVQTYSDVYAQNNKIMGDFIKDTKDVIDVLFGNITLPQRAGFASGKYTADVSKYLGGLILGIESDPNFVINTNKQNQGRNVYDGKYMYTVSASPYEAFFCESGDVAVDYMTTRYSMQVPIAFTNWVTTDPLTHPNEPYVDEDSVSINVENIKCRDAFLPKQFISYHVYPYYPDTLNYQTDYLNYIDPTGKKNPYRAYLRDLKNAHTMPILIGEFGIPTSRGIGHKGIMGYNQGGVDETDVGPMIIDMMKSMLEENYAGGLIFAWQDEWFKRTWNNVKFDIPDKRPYWSNPQTCEQFFGLLSFDPGKTGTTCIIDGKINDWEGVTPTSVSSAGKLFVKSDEKFVYLMINTDSSFNFNKDTIYIPLDTKQNQGNLKLNETSITFDKAADFLIKINGKDNTRIVVDSYYDPFYFLYGYQYKMLPQVGDINQKNSGRFNPMMMCYGYEMKIPITNEIVPFKSFETGKLLFGTNDPKATNYKSLTDFCYKNGIIEVAIPWQLLNVMDPSDKKIMDDVYAAQSIAPIDAEQFSVGIGNDKSTSISLNGKFDWKKWTVPTSHQRLKPAYYYLQKNLVNLK